MKKKLSLVRRTTLAVSACAVLVASPDASAGLIPNGSFEDVFDSWTTIGTASVVGATGTAVPQEGTQQVFLSNAAGSVSAALLAFAIGVPSLPSSNGSIATQGSAIEQTFTTLVDGTLSFDYKFVTNEAIGSARDQTAFYLDGVITLLSSPRSAGVAPGTGIGGYPNGLPYQTITLSVLAGTHTLGFLVYDTTTTGTDSGLFIDNVSVSAPQPAPVPEPSDAGTIGAMLLLAVGIVSTRRRGRPIPA